MERICLPENVETILNRLNDNGYQAFVVGGCVRDSLLGATPHDWDICTSALPDEMMKIFSDQKIIPTGLKHGTVTIVLDGCEYEVTTFRIDGEYKDYRHPESVEFVDDLKLDLMRRDFTINAMAYSNETGIVDYFGGRKDLENKIIRCVGNPDERFDEDSLRILRAIRFASKLNFDIDCATRNAMFSKASQLRSVSIERIDSELIKAITPYKVKETLLSDLLRLLKYVVPELECIDCDVISKRLTDIRPEVRLPLIFDFPPEQLEDILRRMKFSNAIIDRSLAVSKHGNYLLENLCNKKVTKNMSNKPDYIFDDDFEVKRIVYETGCANCYLAICYAEKRSDKYPAMAFRRFWNKFARYIASNKVIYSLKDLRIDGDDLIAIGYKGKEIGQCLNQLLNAVFAGQVENNHEDLIERACRMRYQHGNL